MIRKLTYNNKRIALFLLVFFISALIISSCGKEKISEQQKSISDSVKENDNKITIDTKSNDFIIVYNLEGLLKGNMEIYRSGDKLKQKINSEIMGNKSTNVVYISDKTVYSVIDVSGKKFGTKTDLGNYNNLKQTGETITDFTEFEKFLDSKTISGTESVLGYKCDIYAVTDAIRLYVFNKKYILKIKTPEFIATATDLNTKPVFTTNEFEIPADINFNKTDTKGIDSKSLDSIVNKFKK